MSKKGNNDIPTYPLNLSLGSNLAYIRVSQALLSKECMVGGGIERKEI
jgi:hypothetical protein